MPARSPQYMKDRREQIVSATINCLENLGLAQTSLSDVCTAGEISRGALYVHFASKDELLEAVIQRLGEESFARISFESVESFQNSLEAELKLMVAPSRSGLANIELDLLAVSRKNERLRREMGKAVARRFERLRTGLQGLGDAGLLRPGVDATVAARAIDAFLVGTVTGAITQRPAATTLKSLRLILASVFRTY